MNKSTMPRMKPTLWKGVLSGWMWNVLASRRRTYASFKAGFFQAYAINSCRVYLFCSFRMSRTGLKWHYGTISAMFWPYSSRMPSRRRVAAKILVDCLNTSHIVAEWCRQSTRVHFSTCPRVDHIAVTGRSASVSFQEVRLSRKIEGAPAFDCTSFGSTAFHSTEFNITNSTVRIR